MRGSSKSPALLSLTLAAVCALALVMLTGCDDQPKPKISEALIVVKIVDAPAPDWPSGSAAITRGSGTGLSTIEILRGYYPECVTHEVRHVFEGKWHDQRTTCR
ncbi:hypothetical protein ACNFCJ_07985 [Pseudomonas sp. NY15364]|uniref:hypothetical protein n=1 Tax=Pseudomonas sp. NY15364 TaxID=3400353 RepID=UPI003A83826B